MKTISEAYRLLGKNEIDIDGKFYTIKPPYQYLMSSVHFLSPVVYIMVFVLILNGAYLILTGIVGILFFILYWYIIEFILVLFAPMERSINQNRESTILNKHIKKTLKQTLHLIHNNNITIDDISYKTSDRYGYLENVLYLGVPLLLIFVFVDGYGTIKDNLIISLGVGIVYILLTIFITFFTVIYFAPLQEVEKPKEEVKKLGFFERYKLYKEKKHHEK